MNKDFNSLKQEKDVIGKIMKKALKNSPNPKAPTGEFFLKTDSGELRFTVWDKETYGSFNEGDNVTITYTETQSEWGGKTYTNLNVTKVVLVSDKKLDVEHIKIDSQHPEVNSLQGGSETVVSSPDTVKSLEAATPTTEETIDAESQKDPADIQLNGPDQETYYIVMNGKKYRLVPTGDYLVNGEWKKV
jgi:hypothetical protein